MNKNSKILVAGGTGLVGSAIIRNLIEKNYTNIISTYHKHKPFSFPSLKWHQIDLTNQQSVEKFFEKERPEYVFLAAAKVGGILANSEYVAEFIYDNIVISANIVNSSYKYGAKKLLNLGSSCIYPKFAPQPMKEEYLLTGSLEPTNEPYAIAKISAIKLCRYYNQQYGTNFISVMPTNLYGPNDNFNLETAHAMPALIRKFHLAKLLEQGDFDSIAKDLKRYPIGFGLDKKIDFSNRESILNALSAIGINISTPFITLTMWGTGEVFREFLHVDDAASAVIFLMDKYDFKDIGEFVNIGTGKDLKIKELAKLIKDIVGFKGEIRWDTSKPDGTPRKLLDISKIRELGWQPKISLEEGIRKTYNWYII